MICIVWRVPLHNWNTPHPLWVSPISMVKVATQNVGCLSDDQIKVHLLEGLCHFVVRIIQGADVEVTRDQGGLGVIQHTAQDIDQL